MAGHPASRVYLRRFLAPLLPVAEPTMAQPVVGNCRLCGHRRDLQLSHAIPAWAFRRVADATGSKHVAFGRGVAMFSSQQHAAHMLCTECEQHLGLLDDAASKLVHQEDGRFPLLDDARARGAVEGGLSTLDAETAEDLARFGVSVLWRAHESRADGYRAVRIGAPAEAMRAWLLTPRATPIPRNVTVLLSASSRLAEPDVDHVVRGFVTVPTRAAFRGPFVRFDTTIVGVTWSVFIGTAPRAAVEACLTRTGTMWLGNGEQFMPQTVDSLLNSRRVGKLAKQRR